MEKQKVMLVLNQYDEVVYEIPIDEDGYARFSSMSSSDREDLLTAPWDEYDMLKFVIAED